MTKHSVEEHPPPIIKLLAHDLRWQLLKVLTLGDHRVHELVEYVNQPMNLVSYHLKKLRSGEIVTTRRSESDGRDTYYSLDLEQFSHLYAQAGQALHPALVKGTGASPDEPIPVFSSGKPLRILFVCTHNSARSQMAEGFMRGLCGDMVQVYSAGSHPTRTHPDAIAVMDNFGIDIRNQESTHIKAYEGQSFDYVITVCDRAREVCPTFPGEGVQMHWGFADPTHIVDNEERLQAFLAIARRLKSRIEYFLKRISQEEQS